jgi:hypothetical protein
MRALTRGQRLALLAAAALAVGSVAAAAVTLTREDAPAPAEEGGVAPPRATVPTPAGDGAQDDQTGASSPPAPVAPPPAKGSPPAPATSAPVGGAQPPSSPPAASGAAAPSKTPPRKPPKTSAPNPSTAFLNDATRHGPGDYPGILPPSPPPALE